jgi:hypothetical protein
MMVFVARSETVPAYVIDGFDALRYIHRKRQPRWARVADYNLLFRWFVGLEIDDQVWDATVYTKNRDRLLNQEWRSRSSAK